MSTDSDRKSSDSSDATNDKHVSVEMEDITNKYTDPFQEYLDHLEVKYEDFETYEKTDTKETNQEIYVNEHERVFMIIVIIFGIFISPCLCINLIKDYKYRRSEQLSNLYNITLYLFFVHMLIIVSILFVLFNYFVFL